MKIVDSSGWLEVFTEGPLADEYFGHLDDELLTPTVLLYEVYKVVKRERGEEAALVAAGQLYATELVPLTEPLALEAADVSLEHGLAMADAIVYATARSRDATLVTSDADFEDLPGVVFLAPPDS